MLYQLSPHDAAWLSVREIATSLRKFLWFRDWNNSYKIRRNMELKVQSITLEKAFSNA